MIVIILINSLTIILRTMEAYHVQPETCAYPICTPDDGSGLCTEVICQPIESRRIQMINIVTVAFFILDYVARLATVHAVPNELLYSRELPIDLNGKPRDLTYKLERGPWAKTWHWATSFMPVVDLTSIIPVGP